MREIWTGELVGAMHVMGITFEELAEEAGMTRNYLSLILNGHRTPKDGEERLRAAFARLVARKRGDEEEE